MQFNSRIKNNSYPYYIVAYSYEKEFEKAAKEFETKFAGGSPEQRMAAAEAKLEKLLKQMQDAYARAIKLGETENAPKVPRVETALYAALFVYQRQRRRVANEFLANVLTTPMPDPGAQ